MQFFKAEIINEGTESIVNIGVDEIWFSPMLEYLVMVKDGKIFLKRPRDEWNLFIEKGAENISKEDLFSRYVMEDKPTKKVVRNVKRPRNSKR